MRVLVVDDESELRRAIARRLRAQGHGVDEAEDLETANHYRRVTPPEVVILDRMLPDGDAVDQLQRWRQDGWATPVILLTARDQVADRVEGLSAGADDYLVKPFAMEELLARVASIARRHSDPAPSVVRWDDLEIDTGRREVRRGGVLIPLRPKEYSLLDLLVRKAGQVVSKSDVIDACWDDTHEPLSNVEESLVASLRRKLGKPNPIRTVRGAGYLLERNSRDD